MLISVPDVIACSLIYTFFHGNTENLYFANRKNPLIPSSPAFCNDPYMFWLQCLLKWIWHGCIADSRSMLYWAYPYITTDVSRYLFSSHDTFMLIICAKKKKNVTCGRISKTCHCTLNILWCKVVRQTTDNTRAVERFELCATWMKVKVYACSLIARCIWFSEKDSN